MRILKFLFISLLLSFPFVVSAEEMAAQGKPDTILRLVMVFLLFALVIVIALGFGHWKVGSRRRRK